MRVGTTKIKLAVLTHFPEDPGSPRGGVEAASVYLTRALTAFQDLDVHVVTLDPGCLEYRTKSWGRATIHRLPGFSGSVLRWATGPGKKMIRAFLSEMTPDVIHAHDTYGLMVKGLSMPRVFTVHGFIYADTLVSGQRLPRIRSLIWRWVETSGWADQPHIIAISPYVRERLTGIATGVVHDIDNPISECFFQIERKEREGVIFSAAVISPRKNTLALLEAFAQVLVSSSKAKLRLAGDVVNPGYGKRLMDRIRGLGLEGHVSLLGRISQEQVRDELAAASVFALVSLEENSPMGIEEAMAGGVPVVTSNRCGMPYMVRHGESGFLVDPNSPEDIARRLKQVLADGRLRAKMGEVARAIALDRFHPRRVAERTREVYYEALKGWTRNR